MTFFIEKIRVTSSKQVEAKMHEGVKMVTIDLSDCYDQVSMSIRLIYRLKRLGLYRRDWLCCGFDADCIGKQESSESEPGYIFAVRMDRMIGSNAQAELNLPERENPFDYVDGVEKPAFAVYDPAILGPEEGSDCYKVVPGALLFIVLVK